MAAMNRNIPLSIDDELLAEIDRLAESTKESRSSVMRRAIREGLKAVEAGGGADVISLDSELSKDVEEISREGKLSRAKVILEAIKMGAQAVYNRVMREQVVHAQDRSREEAEGILAAMEQSERMNNPTTRELRMALMQRGAVMIRLWDILTQVPEAWRRHQLVEKLTKLRHSPGGSGGGSAWGCGLSTEEIEWQLSMAEKYGIGVNYPENEVKARETARAREDKTSRTNVENQLRQNYPPDWKPS